ncbi:CoF synthetase [Formosa sp. S-31]|uniref:CoF synthetase n=1 Tax=Formosa sp. S-31 TaxID=2790949 RepID=UPI003EBEF46F
MVRNKIFWTLDLLKGGRIKREYKEIKFVLENLNSNASKEIQELRKYEILQHAISTTPFYKNRVERCSFNVFPVIDKNIILNHYDEFKSEIFLDKPKESAYTSGSTGTPFKVYHNLAKKNRNLADVIHFAKLSGFELGDQLFYIRHWDEYNSRSKFETWKRNIYMHPVAKLSDHDIETLINAIKSSKVKKGILAYASALNVLRDYILKYNLSPLKDSKVNSVIAMSEALNDRTKEVVGRFFGVEVVSRYSNVENGIIAQQLVGSNGAFHINWASYFVEILKLNSDEPAERGELGRIVVTDMFNYCMPMIRYDTGDIGLMGYNQSEMSQEYPVLMRIEGRKMDMIYDADGKFISSYAVYNILKYSNIKQYQFIQEDDKKYVFKLNVEPEFNCETQIKNEFKALLGKDAELEIEYVKEIPLLSSGKRKLVLNRNKKNKVIN